MKTRLVQMNVHVRRETREQLEQEADARGVSMGWLADRLLAEGMDRLVPVDEFRLTAEGS